MYALHLLLPIKVYIYRAETQAFSVAGGFVPLSLLTSLAIVLQP